MAVVPSPFNSVVRLWVSLLNYFLIEIPGVASVVLTKTWLTQGNWLLLELARMVCVPLVGPNLVFFLKMISLRTRGMDATKQRRVCFWQGKALALAWEDLSMHHGHSRSRHSDLLGFIMYHFSSLLDHETMCEIKAVRECKGIYTQILIILQGLHQLLIIPWIIFLNISNFFCISKMKFLLDDTQRSSDFLWILSNSFVISFQYATSKHFKKNVGTKSFFLGNFIYIAESVFHFRILNVY